MDLFRNGTDMTGTGQVPFTRQILSEPFVFLSEPFQFFRSCKRAFNKRDSQCQNVLFSFYCRGMREQLLEKTILFSPRLQIIVLLVQSLFCLKSTRSKIKESLSTTSLYLRLFLLQAQNGFLVCTIDN